MTTIKALIIDDEDDAREVLRMSLQKYCPQVHLADVCGSAEAGIASIRNHKPDLVFLDIQMPGMSGFDVLHQVAPIEFQVIFVSAYDQYAIRAIRFSALDYLLKPINVADLIDAVQRCQSHRTANGSTHQYQSVLNNIQFKSEKIRKLAVPSLEGVDLFDTSDIIYCKAEGSYTRLVMKGKQSKLASRNLKDFENMLSDSGFCRVHNSYLINLSHVQRYIKGEGGYVVLSEDHHVDVSRRKKDEFLMMLDRL